MFFELENLVVSQRHTTSSLLPDPHGPQHFRFVWTLYNARHSLLVFALVFGIAWLLAKRPILEMLAWSLHILIDIPTHQDFRPAVSLAAVVLSDLWASLGKPLVLGRQLRSTLRALFVNVDWV
jgi:hypothetical protein